MSLPNDVHRTFDGNSLHAISVHWFSEGPTLAQRIGALSEDFFNLHWSGNLEHGSPARFAQMAPCQVLVLEIAKLSIVGEEALKLLDDLSLIVEAGLRQGNRPTIVCLGHQLPSEHVARWMQLGMFTYLEASRDASSILQALVEAKHHSTRVLEKYARHQQLKQLWKSMTPDETSVLEMIFDGIPNKTIAARMDVSERTVEARRQRLFQKFASNSLPIVVQRVCEWKQLNEFFAES